MSIGCDDSVSDGVDSRVQVFLGLTSMYVDTAQVPEWVFIGLCLGATFLVAKGDLGNDGGV